MDFWLDLLFGNAVGLFNDSHLGRFRSYAVLWRFLHLQSDDGQISSLDC